MDSAEIQELFHNKVNDTKDFDTFKASILEELHIIS